MNGIKEERILKVLVKAFDQRYTSDKGQGRREIIKLMQDIQSAVSIRDAQQNQLRLNLERALLAENNAIFKCEDTKELTKKRKEIETQIAEKEFWWQQVDADDVYRKEALKMLAEMKDNPQPAEELLKIKYDTSFLRGWVVHMKVISPILFTISWLSGDETIVEIKE
jgi:hypothetical protein